MVILIPIGNSCSSFLSSSSDEIASCETTSCTMCAPRALSNLLINVSESSISSVVTIKAISIIDEPTASCLSMSAELAQEVVGSGVVIQDGYIVTNSHVLRNTEDLIVTFSSGEDVRAVIVGSDPESDIALLKVETDIPTQPIELGNSDDLRVGEMVLSIGSPFALSQTVSLGIISYRDRICPDYSYIEKLIQTDAEINPGNSGGALVNLDGELVGMCTALVSQSGNYQGIGFAIPVNTLARIANDLIHSGIVERNWLGACLQEAHLEFSGETDFIERSAVIIAAILHGSPADLAGLRKNDFITAINGQCFQSLTDFRSRFAALDPESEVSLTIVRNGIEQLVSLEL